MLVFNKIDLLEHDALLALQDRIGALVPSSIFVSSVAEGGLEPLRRVLAASIRTRRPLTKHLSVSVRRKAARRDSPRGRSRSQRMEGERLLVEARVDDALAGRLVRAGAKVSSNGKAPRAEHGARFLPWSRTDSNRGPLLCESSALTS